MGQAWLTVCQRVAKGKLGAVGGAIDNDQLRDVFLEEFRKRLKFGRKDLRDGSGRPPIWSRRRVGLARRAGDVSISDAVG